MKNLLSIIVLILSTMSCGTRTDVIEQLDDIEQYLNKMPDSACVALKQISDQCTSNQRIKAKHSLLYSMALDKSYVDMTSDSIINIAYNYYKKHGTKKDKMLTYYYLGRVFQNKKILTQSIVALMNALEYAQQTNDSFYEGLIYRGLADAYTFTFNHTEELRYRKSEYESFKKSGKDRYSNFALVGIAVAYMSLYDFQESEKYYKSAISLAKEKKDTVLMYESLFNYARMLLLKESTEPQKAIDIFSYMRDSLHLPLSLYAKADLASAYHQLGDNKTAKDIINGIKPHIKYDKILEASVAIDEYDIALDLGNYKEAVSYLNHASNIHDSLYYAVLNNSVMTAQRDFLRQRLEYEENISKSSRLIYILVIALSLLSILVILVHYYEYKKIKEQEIKNSITKLEAAEKIIHNNEQKISSFLDKIRQLYQDKFNLIGGICKRYYEFENIGNRQKFVYKEVESVIDKLSEDKESAFLEVILNENMDGIMTKLRNDGNLKFKSNDYLLLAYWFASFPPSVMSLLIGKDIDVVYNMRSRIKSKIKNSNSQYKDLYLKNMLND